MQFLTIDIETRPHELAEEYINNTQVFIAPKNYKDEEKKDQYIADAKYKALSKIGLHPATSRIWVISMKEWESNKCFTLSNKNEKDLMLEWMDMMDNLFPNHTLAGHNSKNFDFCMLVIACIRNDTGTIKQLRRHKVLTDTADAFTSQFKIKLSDLSWIMGIDDKSMHGSMVADEWRKYMLGDKAAEEGVVEYCKGDVNITHEFFSRYYKKFGV